MSRVNLSYVLVSSPTVQLTIFLELELSLALFTVTLSSSSVLSSFSCKVRESMNVRWQRATTTTTDSKDWWGVERDCQRRRPLLTRLSVLFSYLLALACYTSCSSSNSYNELAMIVLTLVVVVEGRFWRVVFDFRCETCAAH